VTLLRPGMQARYTLPDGSTYELTVSGDELSGRALDAEIARRVFGHEVEPRTNARTGEKDFVQRTPSGNDWVRCAFYSGGGAAIKVSVELQRLGWKHIRPVVKERGSVTVILEHTDGRVVTATGPENTALCLAALKAVRVES
jgi:hypothetical protein